MAVHSVAFGELLRRYRKAAGLTQEELAERAGLSARGISDLERGVKSLPRQDTVHRLAEALRLAPPERALLVAARGRGASFVAPAGALTGAQPGLGATLPPLVGRTREVALLERHLAGEGPPVLVLAGEPGIGKSRLLREARERAWGAGWRVIEGGCQRRGGQEAYAPLLEALKGHLQHRSPAERRADLRGCAWLVRLLPELAAGPIEPLPGWTLPPEQERRLMFEAVGRFLANVAGPAGTLLLLDDLQWAGADALDLVAALLRTPSGVPVRVMAAYRDTEVQPIDALSVLLADLARDGLTVHRTLAPLAPEEAGQLLDTLLEGEAGTARERRDQVVQRAGGVPFFVVSCAQELRESAPDNGPVAVPWDVAQSIRHRVATLPRAAREVLDAAAVIGRVVPPSVLLAVAGQPEQEVLAALKLASRARLLIEEPRGYRFAHDLIREVVETDAGTAQRLVLHQRVAQALEGQAGERPIEQLAYHYGRSGEQDKAVQYLEQAGDRAEARWAHAAAEGYYQAAVDQLDHLGRGADATRAREKLGMVLSRTARYDTALEVLEGVAGQWRDAGDLESLARVTAWIGEVHTWRGTAEEGIARIHPLLETLRLSGPSPHLAELYRVLSELCFAAGRYSEHLAAAEHAATMARAFGDDLLVAHAEAYAANALMKLGQYGAALRVAAEVIPPLQAAGDLFHLFVTFAVVAAIQAARGEFEASMVSFDRLYAVTERMGDPSFIVFALAFRAWAFFMTGDWSRARVDMERAIALLHPVASSMAAPYPLKELGRLCLAMGEWETASSALQEALSQAEQQGFLQALREVSALLAELEVLERRPRAAIARLVPLGDRPGLEEDEVTYFLPVLAWAHLEAGDVGQAADVAARAIARMRPENLRALLVDALRVQAMVAIRRKHWKEAEQALAEGLALAHAMPYPYAEGRLLHVQGQLHMQKGEPEPARARLVAALAIFRHLGARKDAERVKQAITILQSAPPRDAAPQPAMLPDEGHGCVAGSPAGKRLSRTERQAWALERLRTDGPLSPRSYARALGVSVDTALRDLSELTDRGDIVAQGTTKDRRYLLPVDAE